MKKDDNVVVISGNHKGKQGIVLSVNAAKEQVVVEGVRVMKKAIRRSEENQDGERCPVHNLSALSSYEPADCANETKVLPVEINQSFPRQPTSESLSSLIEYRIKILAAEDLKFRPGEGIKVRTNTMVTRKAGKLSMLMKPAENLVRSCLKSAENVSLSVNKRKSVEY